jgi:hypothetical protein
VCVCVLCVWRVNTLEHVRVGVNLLAYRGRVMWCLLVAMWQRVRPTLNGSDLLSLVLRLTNQLGPGAESYIGGYRDGTGAPLRVWHWVDGSNASNINVASQGTPPFPAGQPK